jgi:signal transduction histidine kinase
VPVFPLTSRRRSTLARLAERVLEAPDTEALTRLLTVELRQALGAESASLLLWDRRLESFESVALGPAGRLVRERIEGGSTRGPRARWLLSEGQLVETAADGSDETLVPLLARSGFSGMLLLGPTPRRPPVREDETRLVALITARAAIALENLAYQKELIETERLAALGTMAGMLVHDFRGPLTLIRGWAETLTEGEVPPAEVAVRARAIVEAADRLERMTGETLDFARGAEKLVRRAVSLTVLLAEIAAGLEQELPGLVVELRFELASGRRAALDVDKIRRAVGNIAANARDAMGGAGRFQLHARIETETERPQLVLLLADDGPGIPEAIRERLFEPFVTQGKKRGTGLGLAVARRFVEDHGGRLELVAAPPSGACGACFRITLPLEPAEERPRPDQPPR